MQIKNATGEITLRSGMRLVRSRDSPATLQDAATAAEVRPRDSPATLQDAATAAIGSTGRLGMLQVRKRNDQECYVTLLQHF